LTLTVKKPWSNIGTAHRVIIANIIEKLFVNPTRGSKDIERTRKCDGQTDGQTDRLTDNGAKTNMSPHFMGEDIILPCNGTMISSFKKSKKRKYA